MERHDSAHEGTGSFFLARLWQNVRKKEPVPSWALSRHKKEHL